MCGTELPHLGKVLDFFAVLESPCILFISCGEYLEGFPVASPGYNSEATYLVSRSRRQKGLHFDFRVFYCRHH